MVKKSVKNCNYLNFCLPSGTPWAGLVPLPGQVRAVQTIHHKKWSKMKILGPGRKNRTPPPGHKKKSPCTFDRVFSCLTAEEEGDKVGNNIVCSFLALGKIILKEGQEKNLSNRCSKFHLRKIYKQITFK